MRQGIVRVSAWGMALCGLLAWSGKAEAKSNPSPAEPAIGAERDSMPPPIPFDPSQPVKVVRRHLGQGFGGASTTGISKLADDGAWSWFGDPRALCAGPKTYMGWITSTGDVQVASLERGGSFVTATLHAQLQVDDHDNPSILRLPDGRLMVFYSPHAGSPMFYRVTTNPDDLEKWGPLRTVPGDFRFTYPNPYQLRSEGGTIYLFYRSSTWKPVFSTSTDGLNWTARRTLLDAGNTTPYIKYVSNDEDIIHFAFTESHPELLANNNIYHAYYKKGRFFRADGSLIRTIGQLPLVPAECDKIYDSRAGAEPGWIWDIALDGAGRPVIVYASFRSTTDHRYRYSHWNGTAWVHREMTDAGGSIETSGADPYYSAGIILDHSNPSVVYLSRPATPGGTPELERWTTSDLGKTWTTEILTSGSPQKNIRPFVPRTRTASDIGVLWMRGTYTSYTEYSTQLLCAPGPLQTLVSKDVGGLDPDPVIRVEGSGGAGPRISYELRAQTHVRLDVYDVAGRHVQRLADAPQAAGSHLVSWDATRSPRGVYLVRLDTGDRVETQKITLLR